VPEPFARCRRAYSEHDDKLTLGSLQHDSTSPRGGRLRSYGRQKEIEKEARKKSKPQPLRFPQIRFPQKSSEEKKYVENFAEKISCQEDASESCEEKSGAPGRWLAGISNSKSARDFR